MKNELKGLCAVASILLATAAPFQNARSDILDTVRNYLGPGESGYRQPPRGSYDPYYGRNDYGRYQRDSNYDSPRFRGGHKASTAQQQTAANLDQQSAQLRNTINVARDSGRISNSQASELMHRVDRVGNELDNTDLGRLSFAQAQGLTSELSAVDSRLQFYLSSGGQFRNPANGGRWLYSGRNNRYYR